MGLTRGSTGLAAVDNGLTIRRLGEGDRISSLPGVTYQAQYSDREGNVLQVVPGQGYSYQERPAFSVVTNFSPFKGDREQHPWMGWDRYNTAVELLEALVQEERAGQAV